MIYPTDSLCATHNIKNTAINPPKNKPSHGKKEKEYKDPLANDWLNVVLYSTELGALVHEISPKTAQALWIPTILYLGADVYDKYKNDKTKYSPSGKRGVEQAIYQGIGGFLLPAWAIYLGQQAVSPLGKFLNKGISVNAKEATLTHIKHSLDQCVGDRLSNYDNFKEFVLNSLRNKIQAREKEKQTDGFYKRTKKNFSKKYALVTKDPNKIFEFAEQNVKELYTLKEELLKGHKPSELTKHSYNKFLDEEKQLKATYGKDYANDALRYALKNYENKLLIKNKLVKTAGGIVALALTLKPIYHYVQKTFIPKVVDPGINMFNKTIVDSSSLKQHINN